MVKEFKYKIDEFYNLPNDLLFKEKYEQFYTPKSVAEYMANMFNKFKGKSIKILDPACGAGILSIAIILNLINTKNDLDEINITLYEIDSNLVSNINNSLKRIKEVCDDKNINLIFNIINKDFIDEQVRLIKESNKEEFDYIIMNPPYKKMRNNSRHKKMLKDIGIDVNNYYSGFVSISEQLLKNKGELVAITPRSFCNGVHFLNFREQITSNLYFDKIHLFESRNEVFESDNILQEIMIYHCVKMKTRNSLTVKITHSSNSKFLNIYTRNIKYKDFIYEGDKNYIIHILKSKDDKETMKKMKNIKCTLQEIGIEVSTGPVVDFRESQDYLSKDYIEGSIPLIYPENIKACEFTWPISEGNRNNYIFIDNKNTSRMRPNGNYVIIKRKTSKEDKKRIIACVYPKELMNFNMVGFENRLNYYHINKKGIDREISEGLSIYLNSTFVDSYFRTFSGSTQVNVSDLRKIRYPSKEQLKKIAKYGENIELSQKNIDNIINEVLFN